MTSKLSQLQKIPHSIGLSQSLSRSSTVNKENAKAHCSKQLSVKSTTPVQQSSGGTSPASGQKSGQRSGQTVQNRCRQTKAQLLEQIEELTNRFQSERLARVELEKKHQALRDNMAQVNTGLVCEIKNMNKTIKDLRERLMAYQSTVVGNAIHCERGDVSMEENQSQTQPKNCSTPNVQKLDNSTCIPSNLSHNSEKYCLHASVQSISLPCYAQTLRHSIEEPSPVVEQLFAKNCEENIEWSSCKIAQKEVKANVSCECRMRQYISSDKQLQTDYCNTSSPVKSRSVINAEDTQISGLCLELQTSSESSGFKRMMSAALQECNRLDEEQTFPNAANTVSVGADFSILAHLCNTCQRTLVKLLSPRVSSFTKIPSADDNHNVIVPKVKFYSKENITSVSADSMNTACETQQITFNAASSFVSPNKFQCFESTVDRNSANDVSLSDFQCTLRRTADLQLSQYFLKKSLNTSNTSIFHRSPILDCRRLQASSSYLTVALEQDIKLMNSYVKLAKHREKSQLIQSKCNELNLHQTLAIMEQNGRFCRIGESDLKDDSDALIGNETDKGGLLQNIMSNDNCVVKDEKPFCARSDFGKMQKMSSENVSSVDPMARMTLFTKRRLAQIEAQKAMLS